MHRPFLLLLPWVSDLPATVTSTEPPTRHSVLRRPSNHFVARRLHMAPSILEEWAERHLSTLSMGLPLLTTELQSAPLCRGLWNVWSEGMASHTTWHLTEIPASHRRKFWNVLLSFQSAGLGALFLELLSSLRLLWQNLPFFLQSFSEVRLAVRSKSSLAFSSLLFFYYK